MLKRVKRRILRRRKVREQEPSAAKPTEECSKEKKPPQRLSVKTTFTDDIQFETESIAEVSSGTPSTCTPDPSEDNWPWVWAIRSVSVLTVEKSNNNNHYDDSRLLPCAVADGLYLSNYWSCLKKDLPAIGITHVLNVGGVLARPLPPNLYTSAGISYTEILGAQDKEGYPMLPNHLQEALDLYRKVKASGGKLVIHCMAGHNRSGVLVCALKMITEQLSVLETVAHCRNNRGFRLLSNRSFQEQLVAVARERELLGPAPGTAGSFVEKCPPPFPTTVRNAQLKSQLNPFGT